MCPAPALTLKALSSHITPVLARMFNPSRQTALVIGAAQYCVPIVFVIYLNDVADNLKIDHLLYADDVKPVLPNKPVECYFT